MAGNSLSKIEVKKRLVRLRNLERLHAQQGVTILHLRAENKELKARILLLEARDKAKDKIIDDLKLQIAELQRMIFGRKRAKKGDDDTSDDHTPSPRTPRFPTAYKRKIPDSAEVTDTKKYPIDHCAGCGGTFSERDHVTVFVEDIPLPQKKTVEKHVIAKGYCDPCRKWSAGAPLPVAPVVLGANVKRYVTYLSVVCRQSYAQIQDVLRHTYDFGLSQGEIAKILEKEGLRLRPEYERLKARIRGEPSAHLDETGWNLFIGDGYRRYAWTMVGGESADAVFLCGKTRGKGNAEELLGDSKAVVVSDDYGAYRKMEQPHQLCCAHPHRKLRDLAQSGGLNNMLHEHCAAAYQRFAAIYEDIETARTAKTPERQHHALHERLKSFALPHPRDPAKLARVKTQVRERATSYLTCLLYPGVAPDNNAAERSLRHLVLKRKISFGSFSEKTADTLAVLLSVLLSWKRRGELRGYLMGV
mgnify:CR=1 FL=1